MAFRFPTRILLACGGGGGGLLAVLHNSHQRPQTDGDKPLASSPAAPPWVILGTVARVSSPEIPPGADISLALATPPRVSTLTIPPRVFPEKTTPDNFPSVVATDPSGLLLLHADQGRARDPSAAHRPGRRECQSWRDFIPGYFHLDAVAASALRVPNPERIMHPGHLGLLASPQGGHGHHYMLAELQPRYGSTHAATATLLCFSSEVRKWVTKVVTYPLPSRRLLSPNGVVSHSGMLWWVDLSWCLLACDPCADKPLLRAVPLPPGQALEPREAWGVLDKYRCVGVSAGKLRFVDMYRRNHDAPKISVWTLLDEDSMEWKLECEATFQDICDDETFGAAGLPRKLPVLALIDPTDPEVVYFFLEEHLVGVDVRRRKVVACGACELVAPPSEFLASRFVRAWQLPHAPSSGFFPDDTTGSGSECMESAFPASSLTYVCQVTTSSTMPLLAALL
ncbi:uncharacterized protein LOC100843218 isoform X2 [Brachypodium distachyon]|uniref:uncharacterized protein LOC100843218 isoform X2 n=1 Tax=Brachypodium distachyon TaxID=15368 RepID=UPI0006E4915E|nr:uncharacterized protein LOC100843218 isoform X2 [Brachypodium distachyon]|eukprot:XP_024314424.1 uncharacterized protein LOC100843218 isoform X2 [Brachypodium distachyon]